MQANVTFCEPRKAIFLAHTHGKPKLGLTGGKITNKQTNMHARWTCQPLHARPVLPRNSSTIDRTTVEEKLNFTRRLGPGNFETTG